MTGGNDQVAGGPEGTRESKARRREVAAGDALRGLLRDCFQRHFDVELGGDATGPIAVDLRVRVNPSDGWTVAFDPPVDEQVLPWMEDLKALREVYRPGHVYCFRCGSAGCEHAAPEAPLQVFRGYTSTGVPQWCELAQALMESGDERVDQLFAPRPSILARVLLGHALKVEQLSTFGRASKTYAILGQVVAGYFMLPAGGPGAAGRQRERRAFTLQAVETRDARGDIRLRLNALSGGLAGTSWEELLVAEEAEGLRVPIERAAEQLGRVEDRVREARRERRRDVPRQEFSKIPGILSALARGLERGARLRSRRTLHAEARGRQQRPVHKALEDARAAPPGNLFFDEKKSTYVVCGRQGRAHVFNAAGRHVTTFVLPPGGADFRVRTNRWRGLLADEVSRFRALLG